MPTREQAMKALALAREGRKRWDEERRKGISISRRWLQILMADLGGASRPEIAERFHLKPQSIQRILSDPRMKVEREKIVAAQREKVISGEFGVSAMAKANAEAAMKTIIDQATGKVPGIKESDARRAAVDVLKVSGDMQEKKVTEHVHRLIKDLTTEELQAWMSGKTLPKRLTDQLRVLGIEFNPNAAPTH